MNILSEIDVWKIVAEIEKESVPETRKKIEDFVSTVNGKSYSPGEIVEKVVAPVIGITNMANKQFTVNLIERVVAELQKDI